MAWTTPRTWVAGELVTETVLNTDLRDNLNLLKTSISDAGKLNALSTTYLADLSGVNLTGVSLLASNNVHTAGINNFNGGAATRVLIPVGADLWAV
jgi:hypothetical protein